ncbi:AroM family protein [Pseudalkalibacillus sp. A8]|uniref:AroM family protein n=1 Tax=Pseudalkalibacillus sp. A8 TaxID=3382641 RepID=UPI0038B4EE3E
MKRKIGLLTIGQTPRIDLTPEINCFLGEESELVEMGAIDALTQSELRGLQPSRNEATYITRLKDGTSCTLSKRRLLPYIQEKIHNLERSGVSSTILACTGKFPTFSHEKLIFFPDKLMNGLIKNLLTNGTLGVLGPLSEQEGYLRKKWEGASLGIEYAAVSPYGSEDFELPSKRLKERGVDLIVLDCMGYTQQQKAIVRNTSNLPVVLPRSIIAKVADELS